MRRIPISGFPRERLVVSLQGRSIAIRTRYSSEAEAWTLDVSEADPGGSEVPLISGRRITLGNDLLKGHALRLGALYAIDTTGTGSDPGAGDLGSRVLLFHVTRSEIDGGAIAA